MQPAAPVSDPSLARVPGLLRRLATMLYDLVLVASVVFVAAVAATLALQMGAGVDLTQGLARAGFQLYLLGVIALYYVYFWTGGRQTLGMRSWRTQLLRFDGAAPTPADALLRLGAAALTLAPAGAGLWWALLDRNGLTLYDHLSRTRPVLLASPGSKRDGGA